MPRGGEDLEDLLMGDDYIEDEVLAENQKIDPRTGSIDTYDEQQRLHNDSGPARIYPEIEEIPRIYDHPEEFIADWAGGGREEVDRYLDQKYGFLPQMSGASEFWEHGRLRKIVYADGREESAFTSDEELLEIRSVKTRDLDIQPRDETVVEEILPATDLGVKRTIYADSRVRRTLPDGSSFLRHPYTGPGAVMRAAAETEEQAADGDFSDLLDTSKTATTDAWCFNAEIEERLIEESEGIESIDCKKWEIKTESGEILSFNQGWVYLSTRTMPDGSVYHYSYENGEPYMLEKDGKNYPISADGKVSSTPDPGLAKMNPMRA